MAYEQRQRGTPLSPRKNCKNICYEKNTNQHNKPTGSIMKKLSLLSLALLLQPLHGMQQLTRTSDLNGKQAALYCTLQRGYAKRFGVVHADETFKICFGIYDAQENKLTWPTKLLRIQNNIDHLNDWQTTEQYDAEGNPWLFMYNEGMQTAFKYNPITDEKASTDLYTAQNAAEYAPEEHRLEVDYNPLTSTYITKHFAYRLNTPSGLIKDATSIIIQNTNTNKINRISVPTNYECTFAHPVKGNYFYFVLKSKTINPQHKMHTLYDALNNATIVLTNAVDIPFAIVGDKLLYTDINNTVFVQNITERL